MRFILGPIALTCLAFGMYENYHPYARGIDLLGQAFTLIGGAWMTIVVASIIILTIMCFTKSAKSAIGVWNIVKWFCASWLTTLITAKLWVFNAQLASGGIFAHAVIIILFWISMTVLVMIPFCLFMLLSVFRLEKGKKKDKDAPEKPLSVGKPRTFRALSGQLYEETTSFYKKGAKTVRVAIPG